LDQEDASDKWKLEVVSEWHLNVKESTRGSAKISPLFTCAKQRGCQLHSATKKVIYGSSLANDVGFARIYRRQRQKLTSLFLRQAKRMSVALSYKEERDKRK